MVIPRLSLPPSPPQIPRSPSAHRLASLAALEGLTLGDGEESTTRERQEYLGFLGSSMPLGRSGGVAGDLGRSRQQQGQQQGPGLGVAGPSAWTVGVGGEEEEEEEEEDDEEISSGDISPDDEGTIYGGDEGEDDEEEEEDIVGPARQRRGGRLRRFVRGLFTRRDRTDTRPQQPQRPPPPPPRPRPVISRPVLFSASNMLVNPGDGGRVAGLRDLPIVEEEEEDDGWTVRRFSRRGDQWDGRPMNGLGLNPVRRQ